MKKFLSIAICAIMTTAMVASVNAVDYKVDIDFENVPAGEWNADDTTIVTQPKEFSIKVEKFQDSMCMKFDHSNPENKKNDTDCFINFADGGTTTTHGLSDKFVLSYDVYFEKLTSAEDSSSIWNGALLRMTPPSGTQFQYTFAIVGNQLRAYNGDEKFPIMVINEGKWYNFAVASDMTNKTFVLYVDGVKVSDSLKWDCEDTSMNEAGLLRLGWNYSTSGVAEGIAYVDNIKVYDGEKPEGKKVTSTSAVKAANTADITGVMAFVAVVVAGGAVAAKKKH